MSYDGRQIEGQDRRRDKEIRCVCVRETEAEKGREIEKRE